MSGHGAHGKKSLRSRLNPHHMTPKGRFFLDIAFLIVPAIVVLPFAYFNWPDFRGFVDAHPFAVGAPAGLNVFFLAPLLYWQIVVSKHYSLSPKLWTLLSIAPALYTILWVVFNLMM